MENYEDFIVAWYYENGQWIEFLLDEDTAMKTTNPVFIIDNAEKEITKRIKQNFDSSINISNNFRNTTTSFYSHRYKINKRYENSGRSDFYITGSYIAQLQ